MSSSQKRKTARKEKHLKNKAQDASYKQKAWESGKLIKEDKGMSRYSANYSDKLGERLQKQMQVYQLETNNNKKFINEFRNYRDRIRDYLIYCKPGNRGNNWNYLKNLYDTYLDDPDNLINTPLDHD